MDPSADSPSPTMTYVLKCGQMKCAPTLRHQIKPLTFGRLTCTKICQSICRHRPCHSQRQRLGQAIRCQNQWNSNEALDDPPSRNPPYANCSDLQWERDQPQPKQHTKSERHVPLIISAGRWTGHAERSACTALCESTARTLVRQLTNMTLDGLWLMERKRLKWRTDMTDCSRRISIDRSVENKSLQLKYAINGQTRGKWASISSQYPLTYMPTTCYGRRSDWIKYIFRLRPYVLKHFLINYLLFGIDWHSHSAKPHKHTHLQGTVGSACRPVAAMH